MLPAEKLGRRGGKLQRFGAMQTMPFSAALPDNFRKVTPRLCRVQQKFDGSWNKRRYLEVIPGKRSATLNPCNFLDSRFRGNDEMVS